MASRKIIPTFNIYKTLDHNDPFIFSMLEEAYRTYDSSAPHRHNYYELIFFKTGGGFHEIDFNNYSIQKNSMHFVSPEQVHLLKRKPQATGFVLSFTKDYFLEHLSLHSFNERLSFFNQQSAKPIIQIKTIVQQKEVYELLSKIQSEYHSSNEDRNNAIVSYLSVLLIAARRMYQALNVNSKAILPRAEVTNKFSALVEIKFRQQKSVSSYASLLNITAGHLSDRVQKDTGKTASQIIHDRVILEAKRLLFHSPKSIKEIAFELNYDNPSYFNRFFKKHTLSTPEQFRKQNREKYH